MSRERPLTFGQPRLVNTTVLLREAFIALNDLAIARLVRAGHSDIRPAHAAVFQYLDDDGTTVSTLADRARMTKQAMAELVLRLEGLGYVERIDDPADRRAKLVRPTERGNEVIGIAQGLGQDLERRLEALLGERRHTQLQQDLAAIQDRAAGEWAGDQGRPTAAQS